MKMTPDQFEHYMVMMKKWWRDGTSWNERHKYWEDYIKKSK